MSLDLGDFLQRYLYFFGVWEPNISCTLTDILKPDDVFVDIGAHIGYDTLLAASIVGKSGRVYSFEADPKTYDLLAKNISLNDLTNVIATNCAVMDRRGNVDLFRPNKKNTGQNSIIYARGMHKAATIEGGPLEAYIPENDRLRVRLIKIDVEGAENVVLSGILSDEFLLRVKPDLIVEIAHPREFWKSEIMSRLVSHGYIPYSIRNDYGLQFYVDWSRPEPLDFLAGAPWKQTDVLFSTR